MNTAHTPWHAGVRAALALAAALGIGLWLGAWPDRYGFALPADAAWWQRLAHTPVHLSDDVMITLRAGYMLGEAGRPAYNLGDLAQPATSYLAPYALHLLHRLLPGYLPVLAYAALGLACAALTLIFIALRARSAWLGACLAVLLALTSTHASFALQGWDHLFQACLLTAAAGLALHGRGSGQRLLAALLAAAGALYRPDGILMAAAVVAAASWRERQSGGRWLRPAALFMLAVGGMLALNLAQFGHLTPTTARLKLGASPSLEYSWRYLVDNAWLRYSAGTLLALLAAALLACWRQLRADHWLLLLAAAVTAAAAFANSDVFSDTRMLWMPACVLALLLGGLPASAPLPRPALAACALAALMALAIWGGLGSRSLEPPKNGALASLTAPQYRLMAWIRTHLRPADGPVGLYWLGMAYHIPAFEVADFLGKADEAIAALPVKWGLPGHNKWDVDLSLAKWNPQVIVPTIPSPWLGDTPAARRQHALTQLAARDERGFIHDLLVNPAVQARYLYCHVLTLPAGQPDTWGLYVRQDVAQRHAPHLRCQPP